MHATEQPPLSQRLRQVTAAHHARVERSGPMPALLRGELGLAAYCTLLRNLHPIYRELEAALRQHKTHPALAGLDIDGLARSAALEADLATLHGDGWAHALPLVDARSDSSAARTSGSSSVNGTIGRAACCFV